MREQIASKRAEARQVQLASGGDEARAIRKEIEDLHAEQHRLQQAIKDAQAQQLAQFHIEVDEEKRAREIQREIRHADLDVRRVNRTVLRLETQRDSELDQLRNLQAVAEAAARALANTTKENQGRENDLVQQLSQLRQRAAELHARQNRLTTQRDALLRRIQDATAELNELKAQEQDVTASIQGTRVDVSNARDELQRLQASIDDTREEQRKAQEGVDALEVELVRLRNETAELRHTTLVTANSTHLLVREKLNVTVWAARARDSADHWENIKKEADSTKEVLKTRLQGEQDSIAKLERLAGMLEQALRAMNPKMDEAARQVGQAESQRDAVERELDSERAIYTQLVRLVTRLSAGKMTVAEAIEEVEKEPLPSPSPAPPPPPGASPSPQPLHPTSQLYPKPLRLTCTCTLVPLEEAREAGVSKEMLNALRKCHSDCERHRWCGASCKAGEAEKEASLNHARSQLEEEQEEVKEAQEEIEELKEEPKPVPEESEEPPIDENLSPAERTRKDVVQALKNAEQNMQHASKDEMGEGPELEEEQQEEKEEKEEEEEGKGEEAAAGGEEGGEKAGEEGTEEGTEEEGEGGGEEGGEGEGEEEGSSEAGGEEGGAAEGEGGAAGGEEEGAEEETAGEGEGEGGAAEEAEGAGGEGEAAPSEEESGGEGEAGNEGAEGEEEASPEEAGEAVKEAENAVSGAEETAFLALQSNARARVRSRSQMRFRQANLTPEQRLAQLQSEIDQVNADIQAAQLRMGNRSKELGDVERELAVAKSTASFSVDDLKTSRDTLKEQVKGLESSLTEVLAAVDSAKTSAGEATAEREATENELASEERANATLHAEVISLKREKVNLRGAQEGSREYYARLQEDLEHEGSRARSARANLTSQIAASQEDVSRTSDSVASLEEEVATGQQSLADRTAEVERYRDIVDALVQNQTGLMSDLRMLQSRVRSARKTLSDVAEREQHAKESLAAAREERSVLTRSKGQLQAERVSMTQDLSTIRSQIEAARAELANQQQRRRDMERAAANATDRVSQLHSQADSLEERLQGLRNKTALLRVHFFHANASLTSLQQRSSSAAEEAGLARRVLDEVYRRMDKLKERLLIFLGLMAPMPIAGTPEAEEAEEEHKRSTANAAAVSNETADATPEEMEEAAKLTAQEAEKIPREAVMAAAEASHQEDGMEPPPGDEIGAVQEESRAEEMQETVDQANSAAEQAASERTAASLEASG